ncbi:MAG: hypothetical protein HY645_06580 [Acidobacteria bacterium]|nr:hypothetical protein [Acidobacteriota bacterium]
MSQFQSLTVMRCKSFEDPRSAERRKELVKPGRLMISSVVVFLMMGLIEIVIAQHGGHGESQRVEGMSGGQHGGHGEGGMSMPMPEHESMKTGTHTGRVLSVDQSSMALAVMKNGKVETIMLSLTDQTKTKGEIAPGTEVKVKYREEMGMKLATNIEVKKSKGKAKGS